jgi:hypothetical protein
MILLIEVLFSSTVKAPGAGVALGLNDISEGTTTAEAANTAIMVDKSLIFNNK